jgi:hypothetical protein
MLQAGNSIEKAPESIASLLAEIQNSVTMTFKTSQELSNHADKLLGAVPAPANAQGKEHPQAQTVIQTLRDILRQIRAVNDELYGTQTRIGNTLDTHREHPVTARGGS